MMKIYVLRVEPTLQPGAQPFRYPPHNPDYGAEQDLVKFLGYHPELTADSPSAADWHYLPVYWTRWHLNHDYGRTGLEELRRKSTGAILDDLRTFTVCMYDDGPLVDLGRVRTFLASPKADSDYIIPLLSGPHRLPLLRPRRKYLASFVGRLTTHPIRLAMAEVLKHKPQYFIYDGEKGPGYFVRRMLESYVALSPRGYGSNSFRVLEAMQLGVVPFIIGDVDVRPFKRLIHWAECSLFTTSPDSIPEMIEDSGNATLRMMGKKAQEVWGSLSYQNWCRYLLRQLEEE
jgi:hypothetical protein